MKPYIQLENSKVVHEKIPLIKEVSGWSGHLYLKKRETMVGSLCHADPSGDWDACFLALRGKARVMGDKGERTQRI
ncbi:FAD binding domain-containing protein [Oxyplasma meridianum]|uniref:FAD binding domain-containing protein n=1 Tax=Oxyplasma meridianum TaxID=3073602 RepID=A0AAX4NJ92_9ARCH